MRITAIDEIRERVGGIEKYLAEVAAIIEGVKRGGLEALLRYSAEMDGMVPDKLLLTPGDVGGDGRVIEASLEAARSLREFYRGVAVSGDIADEYMGIRREVKCGPVRRVALYVPARYISTLVMGVVPAVVAGVDEIYVVTPPRGLTPEIVTLSYKLGVRGIVPLGGAHGVAAVALGIGVPKVDKVTGPGSIYVQAAKLLLSQYVGIDGFEGPTELAIYTESDGKAAARDALAQLEHGPASFALVISPSEEALEYVERAYAEAASAERLGAIYTMNMGQREAADVINELAPEHVEIIGAPHLADRITNAGVVSVDTPSALLDYVAGISHILPTGGAARWRGVITPMDYLKCVGYVREAARSPLREAAKVLAEYEGMDRHRYSLEG